MPKKNEPTPMFRQYAEHKAKHKDSILFFRMGDFYEMFKSDAVEVSRLLNLTLTQRQGIPMCGIPHHAAGNYIARLLRLGKKIAICEQIELPADGKGLATRDVVEVVTPGTVVDDSYLDEGDNNYLAGFAGEPASPTYAYIDLSTGEFRVTMLDGPAPRDGLRRELARTGPRELLVQESLLESNEYAFLADEPIVLDRMPDWAFDRDAAGDRLKRQFGTTSLKGFGLDDDDPRIPVAGAVLDYIEEQHRGLLPHVRDLVVYGEEAQVGLDESTIRNLEIVRNLQDGGRSYTLLDTLDHTKTAPGARALKRSLLRPYPDAPSAAARHDRVQALYRDQSLLAGLRSILGGILDIERLSARTAMDRAHAKDVLAIGLSLEKAVELRMLAGDGVLDDQQDGFENLFLSASDVASTIRQCLMDDPSILLTEGRMIRTGWDSELDRMRTVRDDGRRLLDEYIAEEKASTGISSLKLRHNRILGYFIEVGHSQAENMPDRFRRRQTLTQSERFSSPRLEVLETEINSVAERIVDREKELFLALRDRVKDRIPELLRIGRILAEIDVLQSFAHAATVHGYVRPELASDTLTEIQGGRHPVVERHLPQGEFVPNTVRLDGDGVSFAMVTGPNMAGKSTVLRQVALITLMAQSGSFVPADSARIGVADRIYCRVGASDNLARGESTFLVEMNETANILRNATPRSLIIMDEVGRGTGTEDGLAIARAVCEYLLERKESRTMFATHYLELTRLEHPRLRNWSMAVREEAGEVSFPKTLVDGPAESSYGIHVASLAGVPDDVVQRAGLLLSRGNPSRNDAPARREGDEWRNLRSSPLLFDPKDLILDRIRDIDPESMTPLEALSLIAQWKAELENLD